MGPGSPMHRLTPPSESGSARIPKACLPCAQVKARCEIEAGNTTCKRCLRLKKTCSGQAPGAHRQKKVKTSEVARLEEKLDGVAAILAHSQKVPTGIGAITTSSPADLAPATWIDQFIKSHEEAEMILQIFRREMEPHFPFIVTLPSKTFIELREKKPFLALAVLMVGCRHDQKRQTAIGMKIREIISYNVHIKGEKNLDILQSLLVFVNWYHLHLHLGSQLCNLIHLIMAMMIELIINKEALPKNSKPGFGRLGYFGQAGSVNLVTPAAIRAGSGSFTRTLEERRTFLGCFFLTSIVSMCQEDIEPIRHSKYVDDCCHAISEAAEYPTDTYLVDLTRLHSLADRIANTLTHQDGQTTYAFSSAPIGACVKSLESELLQLKSSFVQEAHQSAGLLMHYYVVEVFLYETALCENIDPLRYGTYPFARLNMLYACLNSIKLCFDTVYSFPVSELFDLPYTIWILLGHAVVILSRMSLIRIAGWDLEYARSIIDFSDSMDLLVQRMDEAKALAESDAVKMSDNSLPRDIPYGYWMLTSILQKIKAIHEAKCAAQINRCEQTSDISAAETVSMSVEDEFSMPPMTSFFEFLDASFWQEFS